MMGHWPFERLTNERFRLLETREFSHPDYLANPANRCFYCKTELYSELHKLAAADGWQSILDGCHADDVADHVGGMTAAKQHGVRSPLLEAGIIKSEVRQLVRDLGLAIWDKPAMACLSSRVPHGTRITPELLKKIEAAKDVLVKLGFRPFRVRHHGDVARIEVPPDDLPRILHCRTQLLERVRDNRLPPCHDGLSRNSTRALSTVTRLLTVPLLKRYKCNTGGPYGIVRRCCSTRWRSGAGVRGAILHAR